MAEVPLQGSERAFAGSRWELTTVGGKAVVQVIWLGSRPYRDRGHRVYLETESGPAITGNLWERDLVSSPNARRIA